jgi:hypothetical protein
MNTLIENLPRIIEQAARSDLGIFALMIVAVSIIGFFFFRHASEGLRLVVFLLFFGGLVAFGMAIYRQPSLREKKIAPEDVVLVPPLPVRVLGIQHKYHPDGRYFDFEAAELDALLKRADWDSQIFFISRSRDGTYRPAVMWRRSNGGPGTAHGRYLPEGKAGDWKGGESIFVDPRSRGTWKGS